MSALTSLLVRDRIVPVSKIEEALQAQVLSGGDIDTVLLEMDLVPEDVLSAYRAALFGLLPATRDEVMRAPREAIVRVARDLAKEKNIVPLLLDGRALVVAAIEPLSDSDVRSLRDKLSYEVTARIVTRPRLSAGLAHHYGLELAPRTRRLVDVLRRREPGIIPYVRPPSPSMMPVKYQSEPDDSDLADGLEIAPVTFETKIDTPPTLKLSEPGVSLLPGGPALQVAPVQVALIGVPAIAAVEAHGSAREQNPEDAAQLEAAAEHFDRAQPLASAEPTDSDLAELPEPSEPVDAAPSEGLPDSARVPEGAQPAASASMALTEGHGYVMAENLALGLEVGRATTLPPTNLSPNISRATRGPISAERATQLFEQAIHRDDALFVLLRYAQQFFDFVGIFSIGKEGARGRMAHGAGLSQELMEHVFVPLDGGGLFARVVRDKRPLVGDWTATDEERAAAALLGRAAGRPALAVPILLRGRVVLLVHADRDGVSPEDAGCIQDVAGALRDSLQRIILQNKTLSRSSLRPGEPPPSSAESVAGEGTGHGTDYPAEYAPEPAVESPGIAPTLQEEEPNDDPVTFVDEGEGVDDDGAEGSFSALGTEIIAQFDAEPELTAVDLEAVSRLGLGRRSDSEQGLSPTTVVEPAHEARAPRDGAWGKLPGVPRSAPPPPRRDSGAPASRRESSAPGAASAGAYRYVAATGFAEEKVRSREVRPSTAAPPAATPGAAPVPSRSKPAREGKGSTPRESSPPKAKSESSAPKAKKDSAPARASAKRLSLVAPNVDEPSVIIDMGDQVSYLVDGLMQAPREEEPSQVAELLRLGESALPVLIQHFPGPLWFDKAQLRAGKIPRGRDVSGVARALVAFGDKAAPYLAGKLASSSDEVSYYTLLVAGEIVHPDLLDAVARRALGPDETLRHVALDVLRRYSLLPQFPAVLRALADLSERPGKDGKRQRLAVEALGHLRDGRALQTLIARLSDAGESVAQAAYQALVELTAQDFGPNPRRWETWAEEVGAQHRVEWLIESLMHAEQVIRALASAELKRETQQYFGYHPGLPKRDRELAQRKYREWWQEEGKALFKS
jgi:hypothetical protein